MKNTDQLANALKLLREADSECAAPEFPETRLRTAFREQQAKRRRPMLLMWGWAAGITAVAAVVVIGAFVWRPLSGPASPPTVVAVKQKAPEAPVPEKSVAVAAAVSPRPRPAAPRAPAPGQRRQADPTPVSLAAAGETSQDFFAIPYAPPLTERGEVIRVRLPRQSIRSLGIPVNAERMFERVPADLLVGDDGIPRGVRLVRASEFR